MRPVRLGLVSLLLACAAGAAAPRVTFERFAPAPVDLGGAEEITLVEATGDEQLDEFVESFLAEVNHSRVLRARDGRGARRPAPASLRVQGFRCASRVAQGEAGGRDASGERIRKRVEWVDAWCAAKVEVLSGARVLATFDVRREATSPRAEKAGDDERAIATRQAARYAAVAVAERITPLRVRESVTLAADAPAFDDGMSMIEIDRLQAARTAWEQALRTHSASAPLHFNLGAVCEALGDRAAAARHYARAAELAPADQRFTRELRAFRSRGGRNGAAAER